MTRVVLDTNVLVSGFGWSDPSAAIIDAVTAGELTLLSSHWTHSAGSITKRGCRACGC